MLFWSLCLFLTVAFPLGVVASEQGQAGTTLQSDETITTKGVVVDENGEPVPGANVIIAGKARGTITDVDGKFALPVPKGAMLQVSFIGYITQQVVAGENLKIVLKEDAKLLDEVKVVEMGYGTQRMKNVTTSVAVVNVKELEDLPVSNLGEALAGKIPGVSVSMGSYRPGTSANISIRQSFSWSKDGGTSVPLVVIDDVMQIDPETNYPTLETFNMLDVSEVESITILRDAAAAIYGSRASQGAIIVKTKRGSKTEPRISYNGSFQWNDAVSHGKVMDSYEYGVWNNRFFNPTQTDKKYFFSDEELEKMKNLNYNWLDENWKTGYNTRHAFNVSGGGERANYFIGASYYTQGDNLGASDYDKWNFRAGVDVKLASNFKVSASLSGNDSKVTKPFTKFLGTDGYSKGEVTDYSVLLHMPQYIPWEYDVDGDGNMEYVSPMLSPNRKGNTNQNTPCSWNYFAINNSGSEATTRKAGYTFNLGLQYDLPWVKGLSLKGTYSRTYAFSDAELYQNQFTLWQPQNTYSQDSHLIDENTTWSVNQVKRSARVYYDKTFSNSYQANLYLNYDGQFGDHAVSAMLSMERGESERSFERLAYENTEQDMYFGTSSSAGTLNSNSITYKQEAGSMSYLGRASYSYQDKYLFQFLFRYDASTKFAPENYWGFFPTASIGWVISEEDFFKNNISWVDFLKVRFSVGKTGKDNVKAWKWLQTYGYASDKGMIFGTGSGSATYGGALTPNASPNRDITWDTSVKYNFGIDARFLRGRLSLGLDLYQDNNKNMLIALTNGVPISVGGSLAEENYAAINAYGFELSLGWSDKVGDFSYGVNVHTSWGENKVKKVQEAEINHPWSGTKVIGKSTDYGVWGFKTWKDNGGDGLLRSQSDVDAYWEYLDANARAAGNSGPNYMGITSKDRMKPGMLAYRDIRGELNEDGSYASPDGKIEKEGDYARLVKKSATKGFTTRLNAGWKGIAFSAQIATSWGGYRGVERVKQGTGSSNFMWSHPVYLNDMFDEEMNPNGKWPNMAHDSYNNNPSDFWTLNTFRCYVKNLGVSYSLPKEWLKKINISQVRINLTGNNLWDFYNPYPKKYRNMYDNYDVDYPTLRTWSLGLSLTL